MAIAPTPAIPARPARRAGVTSGNSGSLPTSGEIFQDLAHFWPCGAIRARTATPETSSSRKASAGPSPASMAMSEVMQTSAKSTDSRSARKPASAIKTFGAASSEEPIRFCARSISKAPVTTDADTADFFPFFRERVIAPRCAESPGSLRDEPRPRPGNAKARPLPR